MTRWGIMQRPRLCTLCATFFIVGGSAFAQETRFFPLRPSVYTASGNNFLVLRPGEAGNTASSTTTIRPRTVRFGATDTAAPPPAAQPAPSENFYSLKRYQPLQRHSYSLNNGLQRENLQLRNTFASPSRTSTTKELASKAPYNQGFYGTAYAGGTEQSWPVDLAAYKGISSGFGWRNHPVTGHNAFHKGVDLAAPSGAAVLASADGIVEEASQDRLLGKFVKLRHTDGSQSLYGHLSAIYVKQGDWLSRQQRLGAVGATGRTTGPHLHYSLNVNDQAVNPMEYLTRPPRLVASR